MSFSDVDCEACANYKDESVCLECNNNPYFENYFTPMSLADKAKREADERREILSKIPKIEASIDLKPEFMSDLKRAWSITQNLKNGDYRLFLVYCSEGFIMGTDSFRLVKIKTQVTKELVGKYVILDQDTNKLYVYLCDNSGKLWNYHESAQGILGSIKGIESKFFKSNLPVKDVALNPAISDALRKLYPKLIVFNENIFLNKSLLDGLLEIFPDEEITVTYKGPLDPVRFATGDIEAVILPVRTEKWEIEHENSSEIPG
ncbi:hypothetical protein REC12_20440 [Desulfosporosinus sp. PR]|uniref:hypothetical protein n=1 Tax=Candidatus Desulfosporosinus nitrosoreducens TaxID=3401928 RepID=UPI0027E8D6A4|nr:hypothetical protein [Desulfosporosinus sp. PR]MDQ7095967.1 hypothetical protein [Desulfosporosinus sp. PR]